MPGSAFSDDDVEVPLSGGAPIAVMPTRCMPKHLSQYRLLAFPDLRRFHPMGAKHVQSSYLRLHDGASDGHKLTACSSRQVLELLSGTKVLASVRDKS